ncbi:MAG: DUF2341 domain-containing protein [Euryarchaeota archaeon]|nr:DUF2341 domain-containing protein [Euryarchaeota archaeon]
MTVKDISGIATVQAKNYHEKGFDVVNLQLVLGTMYDGVWKGTWVVHDTLSKEYDTVITAFSYSNLFSSIIVSWSDPSWWDMSWNYRKLANIQNPSLNYQMKITIGYNSSASNVDVHLGGKCKTDFSDVRFTNKNNSAELSYWMENKTNGDKAQFWVKTNGEDALNIYYGNAAASSHNNGSATFPFFDDFLGTSLGSQWIVSANSYTVSGGILRINIGSVGLQNVLSFNLNSGYIVEGKILYHTNAGGYSGTLSGQSSIYTQGSNAGADATSLYMRETGSRNVNRWTGTGSTASYNCGNSNVFTSVDNVWYILGAQFDASGVVLTKDRTSQWSYGCGWVKNINYISLGGFYGSASYDIQDTSYDWILIRKYVSPAPSWSSFGSQEIALPTQPIPSQPSDYHKTTDTTPTFQWTISQNAGNHTIQISNSSDFTTLKINSSLGPTTDTFTPTVNLEEGKWYWRIRANNTQGINISDVWNFIIDTTAPNQPLLSLPTDNYDINNNYVTFSWNETADNTTNTPDVSGISCYQLQISNDNFTSLLVNQNTSDNLTFSITTTVAGRLQWRVRAWDQAGNSGTFSEIRNLTIFDFSLTATSSALTILRGGTGSTTIQIQVSFGDDEAITLSNEWVGLLPTGLTINFSKLSGNGAFTSIIDFVTSGDASTGEFIFNVIATSLTGTRTLPITVRIAGMIFQMSASPTSFSLTRSDTDESRISITFQYGSKESVSLSGGWVGSSPSGVTTTFSSVTDLPPFDSILSISTSNRASSGKYTYKITATGGGISDWIYISLDIKTNLTLTVESDKPTYEKGQEIQLSGTVDDPNGNAVKSGTVTLNFSTGTWSEQMNAIVTNGVFQTKYYITFDKFEGNWIVAATAVDSLGHTTAIATRVNIIITVPEIYKYYTIAILSPLPGQVYKRGEDVSFTVSIVENETKIRGATVTIQPPDGTKVILAEISPGLYSKSYTLRMNSQLGNWSVYIAGSTGENEMFKAGFNYVPIKVKPTELSLEIVEPIGKSFETGEKITFIAKLLYPDGSPVEEGIVSAMKNDGITLNFKKSGNGLYTAVYTVTDEDLGYLNMQISATDVYGNLGVIKGTTLEIIPMQLSSYFVRYWWLTGMMLLGLSFALGVVTRDVSRTVRLRNFKREVMELSRLKKDKATEYFISGSISRETYDNLLQEYESKLAKLEKQRHIIEKKMRKKKK